MYTVRTEGDFAAAHRLMDYHGKCEKLHGHNYRVRVHAEGNDLDSGGMLVDFGILKSALRGTLALLDHSDLNEVGYFGRNPSAERIARYIFEELEKKLPEVPLCRVDVYETPVNRASWKPDRKAVPRT